MEILEPNISQRMHDTTMASLMGTMDTTLCAIIAPWLVILHQLRCYRGFLHCWFEVPRDVHFSAVVFCAPIQGCFKLGV